TPAMVRRCLSVRVSLQGNRVDVEVRADDVGHRVPTGFIDRHLLLTVEAWDAGKKPVPLTVGPKLPRAAADLANVPGKLYGKWFPVGGRDSPLPFWLAHDDPVDTRLHPGKMDFAGFVFVQPVANVRVRLIYRRQWPAPGNGGASRDGEIVVVEQMRTA